MKYLFGLFLLFFCFVFIDQNPVFVYKSTPKKYMNRLNNFPKNKINKIQAVSYPIIKSLPLDYDRTGTVDYTDIIQKALDSNRIVTFPNFPLLINSKGLTISSNSKIIFEKGSKLLLQPNKNGSYEILRLRDVTNVVLYSPNVIGDREKHQGTTGEWGFGISIKGSQNIKIYNATVKNCWGDGIYLGSYGSMVNTDITIGNCFLDNNRRNGISIISGINITISNTLISNTNGTAPMSGIDLEPNSNNEFLKNVALKNIITFNNKNEGILIVLRGLHGKEDKNVTIAIENHIDDNSGFAMGFAFPKKNADFKNIEGNVTVTNSIWKDNTSDLVAFHDNNDNFVNFKFLRPKIINKDTNFSHKKFEKLKSKREGNFLVIE
jgi:hypothetical protein